MEQLAAKPLAEQLRPESVEQVVGQRHLLESGKPLRAIFESGHAHSMVLWGPPGTGKTTLARLMARYCETDFIVLSAVTSGIKDIRKAIEQAQQARLISRNSILFIDEAHRFNRSQQDAFLPHIESGLITFVGATTENPSFSLNNALLSRVKVYVLKSLDSGDIRSLVERALLVRSGHGDIVNFTEKALQLLIDSAAGDARRALNALELIVEVARAEALSEVSRQFVAHLVDGPVARFDRGGDEFYSQISALHKSIRGSDPDASLYWLARMLKGGCDPLYLARRLVRIASEDIGNADLRALPLTLNAWDAWQRLGSPEGELALAQAVVYLAATVKSNAVYQAFAAAGQDADRFPGAEVPKHLRNSVTPLDKKMGHGKDYRYAHDEPHAFAAGERYFPVDMPDPVYYQPTDRGMEKNIRERLQYLKSLDRK